MNFTSQGVQIGLFTFSYYGMILVLAFLLSLLLAYRRVKVRKLETQYLWMMALVVLITAILGARIWYACFPPASALRVGITPEYFRNSLLDLLAFWQGGFALPGAIIGGFIGLFLFILSKRLNFSSWLRALVPVLPFATAIAIWGNFITQENYGLPSALPWAIYIQPQYRAPGYTSLETFQPLFLYQSLWALFTVIVVIRREKIKHNDRKTIPSTVALMSIGFLLLETIRIDTMLGIASTMTITFWTVMMILSLMRLYFMSREAKKITL